MFKDVKCFLDINNFPFGQQKLEIMSLGSLVDNGDLPAIIPILLTNSIIIKHHELSDTIIGYIEYLFLQLLFSGWYVKLYIYDESLESEYGFFARLKVLLDVDEKKKSSIEIIRSKDQLNNKISNLWDDSLNRKDLTLEYNETWLKLCKNNNSEDYSFKFILLKNNASLSEITNKNNFLEMIEKSGKFGINFVIIHDELYQANEYDFSTNVGLQKFNDFYKKITDLPSIHIIYNQENIQLIAHEYFSKPFEVYNKLGGVRPYIINKDDFDKIHLSLKNSQQKSDANHYEDYIVIDIGRFKLERFSIAFGQKSNTFGFLLVGQKNSGKSTFLKHLIVSICEKYSHNYVSMSVCDPSGEADIYNKLPHFFEIHKEVGIETLMEIFGNFQEEHDRRIKTFNDARNYGFNGELNLYDYNKWAISVGEKTLPVRILIFDEVRSITDNLKKKSLKDYTAFLQSLSVFSRLYRKAGFILLLCSQDFDETFIATMKPEMNLIISLKLSESVCDAVFERRNRVAFNLSLHSELLVNNDFGKMSANKVITLDSMSHSKINDRINQLY